MTPKCNAKCIYKRKKEKKTDALRRKSTEDKVRDESFATASLGVPGAMRTWKRPKDFPRKPLGERGPVNDLVADSCPPEF